MIARDQLSLVSAGVVASNQSITSPRLVENNAFFVKNDSGRAIRGLFWLYIVLLLTEGALRKWIVPSLSNYLLFARDPVVLVIYLLAIAQGIFPSRGPCAVLYPVAIVSTAASMVINISHPLITIVGFKSNFLHLPLLYVIPAVFTRQHVIAVGRVLMILAILMVPLIVIQFRASPDSIWNIGAGGIRNGQLAGALGKIRPPGIFSFVTGITSFCPLVAAFIINGFLESKNYSRTLLLLASVALILTVALSISRSTIAAVATVLAMTLVMVVISNKLAGRVSVFLVFFGITLLVVSSFDLFKEGKAGMDARLENTGDLDRGVIGTSLNWSSRVFGDLVGGIHAAGVAPLLGAGIGLGTNAGSMLSLGRLTYILAEGEWARVVLEMGPLLGLIYIGIRIAIVVSAWNTGVRAAKFGNVLPILLFGTAVWPLFNGQFGQPTILGFAILSGVLCFAAQNMPSSEQLELSHEGQQRVRCRSRYAEFLHGQIPRSSK